MALKISRWMVEIERKSTKTKGRRRRECVVGEEGWIELDWGSD